MVILTDPAQQAYRGAAGRWERDAMAAYGPLADHLVARSPIALTGAVALDAGSGTGAASAALRVAGAQVVAVDLEPSMLIHGHQRRPPAAAADVAALPFVRDAFDLVVAAFVLNHVVDPAAALAELARVTRPGGALLASTFSDQRAQAKSSLDDTAKAFGWSPPPWYTAIQARQCAIGTPARLLDAARRAGLHDVDVVRQSLDVRLDDAASIVRYRLGMPQYASFLDTLNIDGTDAFLDAAIAAVATEGPFRPEVIELVARVS